jgi:hypothetical protein
VSSNQGIGDFKMNLSVLVTFDCPDIDKISEKTKEACKVAGRYCDESGYGFGQRDLGWYCETKEEAEKIKSNLEKIGLEPYIIDYDEEVELETTGDDSWLKNASE